MDQHEFSQEDNRIFRLLSTKLGRLSFLFALGGCLCLGGAATYYLYWDSTGHGRLRGAATYAFTLLPLTGVLSLILARFLRSAGVCFGKIVHSQNQDIRLLLDALGHLRKGFWVWLICLLLPIAGLILKMYAGRVE